MAMISGLQAPNPYAQLVSRAKQVASRPADAAVPSTVPAHHAAYSPDWMQAESGAVPPGETATLYSAKGQLQKLPSLGAGANEPMKR